MDCLPREPYVMLGCSSGNVRAASMVDQNGAPATSSRPCTALVLSPLKGECTRMCTSCYCLHPCVQNWVTLCAVLLVLEIMWRMSGAFQPHLDAWVTMLHTIFFKSSNLMLKGPLLLATCILLMARFDLCLEIVPCCLQLGGLAEGSAL